MLAYIFWHWPVDSARRSEYERDLSEFHAQLGESGCEGFIGSTSFRVEGAPWINGGRQAYADWYLVEGSFALDPLNDVAVSGSREASHDRAAHAAAGGVGGLYRLRGGEARLESPRYETWLTKPKTMPYPELYDSLRPLTQAGATLWRRQMVLGPAPEFCLVSRARLDVPPGLSEISVVAEMF